MRCYPHFILPMRSSRGFASTAANLIALFRLAFASAPPQNGLTLLMTVSRRIIMQKARRHTALAGMVLRPLVGMWFQVHYPPLVGVLPIFRSRYWFAIGRQGVLSLAGWAPQIRDRLSRVRSYSGAGSADLLLTRTGLSPSMVEHSRTLPLEEVLGNSHMPVLQPPTDESVGFRLFRVRSPLLTESLFLSFPRGTEMFQFPRFATYTYGFSAR